MENANESEQKKSEDTVTTYLEFLRRYLPKEAQLIEQPTDPYELGVAAANRCFPDLNRRNGSE